MSLKKMAANFTSYLGRDEGAVTVDFVALMAMICLFGIAVAVAINTSTRDTADKIADSVDTMSLWTYQY